MENNIKFINIDKCYVKDLLCLRLKYVIDNNIPILSRLTSNQREELRKCVFSLSEWDSKNCTTIEFVFHDERLRCVSQEDLNDYYFPPKNAKLRHTHFAKSHDVLQNDLAFCHDYIMEGYNFITNLLALLELHRDNINEIEKTVPFGFKSCFYQTIEKRDDGYYDVRKNYGWGIANESGDLIVNTTLGSKVDFKDAKSNKLLDKIVVTDIHYMQGVLDNSFNFILPIEFYNVYFQNDYILACNEPLYCENGSYAVFTNEGKRLTTFAYHGMNNCPPDKNTIEVYKKERKTGSYIKPCSSDYYKKCYLYTKEGEFITGGYTLYQQVRDLLFLYFGGFYADYDCEEFDGRYHNSDHIQTKFVDCGEWLLAVDSKYSIINIKPEISNCSILHKSVVYKEGKLFFEDSSSFEIPFYKIGVDSNCTFLNYKEIDDDEYDNYLF